MVQTNDEDDSQSANGGDGHDLESESSPSSLDPKVSSCYLPVSGCDFENDMMLL